MAISKLFPILISLMFSDVSGIKPLTSEKKLYSLHTSSMAGVKEYFFINDSFHDTKNIFSRLRVLKSAIRTVAATSK